MRALMTALLLICLPLTASAQMYRCTQPDGKVGFQDRPCQTGSTGEQIEVRPPSLLGDPEEARKVAAESARKREFAAQQQISEELAADRKARAEAPRRRYLCDSARYNMTGLKAQRPVYSTDEKGNKQYLPDSAREAEIRATQRVIDENCD